MVREHSQKALSVYKRSPTPLLLESGIQHYAWGDPHFIPSLLGLDNPEKRPYAELWMGAHPDLPSRARLGDRMIPLNELIAEAADEVLGPQTALDFSGHLPFLLKLLSAAVPLSIQAHPSRECAREGFAQENAQGIPLTARERNYKDQNHKPELIVAVTEFHALRGFRPLAEIAQTLEEVPELGQMGKSFRPVPGSLRSLYEEFMSWTPEEVDSVLDPLLNRLTGENENRRFTRERREYWVLRADAEFSTGGHRDRGLLSIYLLNLVCLQPGEALFLPAGILHAYLQGSGIEIMANSNNVLRGGLTPKHVDVPQLLNNLVFDPGPVEVLRGIRVGEAPEWVYKTPAREFELSRILVGGSHPYSAARDHGAEILFLMESSRKKPVTIVADSQTIVLGPGQACLVPRELSYRIQSGLEATLFKATIPFRRPKESKGYE